MDVFDQDRYEYDEPHYSADLGDRYGPETAAQLARQAERTPGHRYSVELSQWEHELAQPDYPDYFLEEMLRCQS